MPRLPRKLVVAPEKVAAYHCVKRCVRGALLCGRDPVTGRSLEHRRKWIRGRMESLAGECGVDVLCFAIMGNHLHVVIRTRPDVVAGWCDDEVVRRWWAILPARRGPDGSAARPTAEDLKPMSTPARVKLIRRRLSDVSWFLRLLSEPIARWANKEDGCTGRFWEGRFKCQPLLDAAALVACCSYVDLNPVRAGIAKSPEASEFTSIHERIHAAERRLEVAAVAPLAAPAPRSGRTEQAAPRTATRMPRDGWLSPIPLEGPGSGKDAVRRSSRPSRRASDDGFLPMNQAEYIRLIGWTARQLRREAPQLPPADLQKVFDRLPLPPATWLETVRDFGRLFGRFAGGPESLAAEAKRRGQNWLGGIAVSRRLFGTPHLTHGR
jgi:REP element-mobilizing transposase RayT